MLLASPFAHQHRNERLNPLNTFQIPQLGLYNARVHEFILARLTEVVRQAAGQLVPVTVGTSTTQIEGWNRNRRNGPVVDKDLTVTRIDTAQASPWAVLVNFTAHPTFMSGEDMLFSGDWPGHLQRTVESLVGDGVTTLYYNGAEGDQAPLGRPDAGDSRWERAERYGRDWALWPGKQWGSTKTSADAPLAYHTHSVALPERTWHPDFMKTGGAEYGLSETLFSKCCRCCFRTRRADLGAIGRIAGGRHPGRNGRFAGYQDQERSRP